MTVVDIVVTIVSEFCVFELLYIGYEATIICRNLFPGIMAA